MRSVGCSKQTADSGIRTAMLSFWIEKSVPRICTYWHGTLFEKVEFPFIFQFGSNNKVGAEIR